MDLFEELKVLQEKINTEVEKLNKETAEINTVKKQKFEADVRQLCEYITKKYIPLIEDRDFTIKIYDETLVLKPRWCNQGKYNGHYCSDRDLIMLIGKDGYDHIIWCKSYDEYNFKHSTSYEVMENFIEHLDYQELDKVVATEITCIMNKKLSEAQIRNRYAKGE